MLFNAALLTGLFLASEAVAFPSGLAARLARRREGRQSQPSKHLTSDTSSGISDNYSPNWAGAVLSEDAGTFTASGTTVTGTFTVPSVSGSPGDAATAWVGIDGYTCQSAILQTGVDFEVGDDDSVGYYAWYEWFPAPWVDFSGISFSAGDVVTATVVAYSTTSGVATIENLSTGVTVSQNIGDSNNPLCGQDAEWIVEDYKSAATGQLVPLANFGTVIFTDVSAGPYSDLESAYTVDIQQNGAVLTSTTISSDYSSVTIEYTGGN